MQLTAEITLYPNQTDFIPPIDSFIARLNQYTDSIKVLTMPTATIVQGDYDEVMHMLTVEMKAHREAFGMGPFIVKFLAGYEALK